MREFVDFLLRYGYWLTFGAVFIEQIGVPLPAVPILVTMGALARSGDFSFGSIIFVALLAALTSDLVWYNLGRRHGRSVLRLICRISLEPDSCVRRTEDAFSRRGLWSLLLAKFVPGLNAAAVPLVGMIKGPFHEFLIFDIAGLLLWAGGYTLLGFVFSDQVERLLLQLSRLGNSIVFVIGAAVAGYISYKVLQRRRFLRTLETARITPDELKSRLDRNEGVLVFDLRNPLEITTDRIRIPGAFHVLPEALGKADDDFPRDKDVVLYCTCPNEATSARVARQLRQMGLVRVLPLKGGLDAWRDRGFPVEAM